MKKLNLLFSVLILTSVQSVYAGSTGSLLRRGLEKFESDDQIHKYTPFTEMSETGLRQFEIFEAQKRGSDYIDHMANDSMLIHFDKNEELAKHTGVVNTLRVKSDGSVIRSAFNLPRTELELEHGAIGRGVDDYVDRKVGATTVWRYLKQGENKSIKLYETFAVLGKDSVSGRPWRRTLVSETMGDEVSTEALIEMKDGIPAEHPRSVHVGIENSKTGFKGSVDIHLSDYEEGEVLHFRVNAQGTAVTIVTTAGNELKYALTQDVASQKLIVDTRVQIASAKEAVWVRGDYFAETVSYPGRKAATVDLRGLSVESNARRIPISTTGH